MSACWVSISIVFKELPILTLEVMLKIQDEQGFKEALFKHIS